MPITGPVIPLPDIQAAVADLIAGLIHGDPIPAHRWDHAVTTLARSHQQLGGATRRLVYATVAGAHPHAEEGDLPRALAALGRSLGVADAIAPDKSDSGTQLRLF